MTKNADLKRLEKKAWTSYHGDGLVDCTDPNCGGALCDGNGSRCIALTCQPE